MEEPKITSCVSNKEQIWNVLFVFGNWELDNCIKKNGTSSSGWPHPNWPLRTSAHLGIWMSDIWITEVVGAQVYSASGDFLKFCIPQVVWSVFSCVVMLPSYFLLIVRFVWAEYLLFACLEQKEKAHGKQVTGHTFQKFTWFIVDILTSGTNFSRQVNSDEYGARNFAWLLSQNTCMSQNAC